MLEIRWPDRLLVYSERSGRHLVLPPDAKPDPALLARRLAPGAYPARSRLALLLPQSGLLWHPVPDRHGAGGHAFAGLPLDVEEQALWRACDGSRPLELPASFLRKLLDPKVQALQLRPSPVRGRVPALERIAGLPREPGPRVSHHHDQQGATALGRYHRELVAERHFDEVETTVAHAFALPHPALQGQRYGSRLRRLLGEGRVLELGAGSGELAEAWGEADYTRVDLSAELLAAQAHRAPWSRSVQADATALPFADSSFDVVVCNEVIADLEASPTPPHWLSPAEGQRLFNRGAFAALEQIARVLRPGGRAWISEFGGLEELPTETEQLDHPEVSIHFGQLLQRARTLGLEAHVEPLVEALGADPHARWLSRASFMALRARWPQLACRAVQPPLPEPVEGLWTVPVTEAGPGPALARFSVLRLRKTPA